MDRRFDVFLSHTSADKATVAHLASRLTAEAGLRPFLDVWHLVPGDPWQEGLERALDASATCAVFLGPSQQGSWAHEEMRTALEMRHRREGFRVIPVLLPGATRDGTSMPPFLTRLTWVDFSSGVDDPHAFRRLVAGVRGDEPGPDIDGLAPASATPGAGIRRWLRPLVPLAFGTAPLVLAAVALAGSFYWKVPTRVRLDVTASRLALTVGAGNRAPIVTALPVASFTVRRFETVSFRAAQVEVGNPARYDVRTDTFRPSFTFPYSPWSLVGVLDELRARPSDGSRHFQLVFSGRAPDAGAIATVGPLVARDRASVVVEAPRSGAGFTIGLDGAGVRAVAVCRSPFRLVADYVRLSGLAGVPFNSPSLTYRVEPGRDPGVEIAGGPAGLTLSLVPAGASTEPFATNLDVEKLELEKEGDRGRETSLTADGQLTYPDHPNVPAVAVDHRDLVMVTPQTTFRVLEIAQMPNVGLHARIDGVASEAWTASAGVRRDRRITLFDRLWHEWRPAFIVGLVVLAVIQATCWFVLRTRAKRV